MMNVCLDSRAPADSARTTNGTFPIVAWSRNSASTASTEIVWGAEAIMLSAGTNIEWLRDDLAVIASASESHDVAQGCPTAEGVVFVPALLGLGTPRWDYGARGTLLGLTRGSTRAHVVRAVLEGIAHRGADLLESLTRDHPSLDRSEIQNAEIRTPEIRIEGRTISVSPVTEATTLGAAYLAGLAVGTWSDLDDIEALWSPMVSVDPSPSVDRDENRREWAKAVTRAAKWIPELSALDF
jgi:glycerol kinase